MSFISFLIITLFTLIVIAIILYNVSIHSYNRNVRYACSNWIIFIVIFAFIYVFALPTVYDSYAVKGEEVERYEVIEAALTSPKTSPRYTVSYANKEDEIIVANIFHQEYTDDESYVALHKFRWGFLYSKKYVYYIKKSNL